MMQQANIKAATIPGPVCVLGLAGLIPFIAGALLVAFSPESKAGAAAALLAYGAVSLSFLGGIRWGFAVMEGASAGWGAYGLSVVPAAVAWIALYDGGPFGLTILALAIGLWIFAERGSPPETGLPAWYIRLRIMLSVPSALSLIAAALTW
jgi:hypothetical protein